MTEYSAQARVRAYYQASTDDYLKYYDSDWHGHMHYGFERNLPPGGNPTENLVQYMAAKARLGQGMRVLDAGCGVGGSSRWLAARLGCTCTGLNLMDTQAVLATQYARREGLSAQARFVAGDFMRPPFCNDSFDAIWAIESSDHAPDKAAWVRQMSALLRPGGVMVVADGFRAERPFSTKEESRYQDFLKGWAVPHLATVREFRSAMEDCGMAVEDEDITADVMPHAFAIYRFGFLFVPWRRVLLALGLTSPEKYGNAVATLRQYSALRDQLWSYRILVGRKVSP